MTSRDYADILGVDHSAIIRRFKKLNIIYKKNLWVPHNLSEKNRSDRVRICQDLLNKNNYDPFLQYLVTMDEKWIVYDNAVQRGTWLLKGDPPSTTPKADIHGKKLMISVWWDCHGIIYWEFLPINSTITADSFCKQLDRVYEALSKLRPSILNRRKVILHMDNARPHTAVLTKSKIKQLRLDILNHPPYSPDISPSDYHLFRSMQNSLNGCKFKTSEEVYSHVTKFFESKSEDFYRSGIFDLKERWQRIIDTNGDYCC